MRAIYDSFQPASTPPLPLAAAAAAAATGLVDTNTDRATPLLSVIHRRRVKNITERTTPTTGNNRRFPR